MEAEGGGADGSGGGSSSSSSSKDASGGVVVKDIKIHFIGFIRELVGSFPLDKRRTLIRKVELLV